jgi:tetratricopeptide (TPR) repeat protein
MDSPDKKKKIIPVRRSVFKNVRNRRFYIFFAAALIFNAILLAIAGGSLPGRKLLSGLQPDLSLIKLSNNEMPKPTPSAGEKKALISNLRQAFNAGDMQNVIDTATNYLDEHPGDPERDKVLMWRADAYIGLEKDYDKAEADAKEVIKMGKQGATPYLFLASHIYNDNNKNWEGYFAIRKAYELRPDIEKDPFFMGKKSRIASFYTIAGELAHDCGDYRGSIEFIKKAIAIGPLEHNSLFARNEIAMAYYKLGETEKAETYSKEWLVKDAPVLKAKFLDYNYYINMSNANMILGNADAALKYLDECRAVVSPHKKMAIYYFEKGRIYFRVENFKKARENFDYLRKKFPGWEDDVDTFDLARMERIISKKQGGRPGETLTEDTATALKSEASRLMNEHHFQEAAARLTVYIENYADENDMDEMLLKRADAYIGYIEQRTDMPGFSNLTEYKLAEADLKEAARRGKTGATPYLMMATQLYCGNDSDEKAYNALKQAYKIKPDIENDRFFITYEKGKPVRSPQKQAEFFTLSGSICEKVGKYDEAVERYNKTIDLNDKNRYPIYSSTEILRDDALLYRARAYFKMGDPEKARRDASQWLEKYKPSDAEHPEDCENLAWAYLMTGNYEEALKFGNRMIELNPEYYGTYLFLAAVNIEKGDYNEAQSCINLVNRHIHDGKFRYDMTELHRLEKKLKDKSNI